MDNLPDINALKMGMMLESLEINSDEMVVHWKDLSTELQQNRQATMIGFWAIKNFPSLGKKLFGNSWQAPQRKWVHIVGQTSMMPDQFDTFIFEKMKLRIMELRVSPTTLPKLNNFVKAPIDIPKSNKLQISQKVVSFDIESEFLQQCWDALKSGIFTVNDSNNANIQVGEDIEVVGEPTDEGLRLSNSYSNTESCLGMAKRRRTDNYLVTDAFDDFNTESRRSNLLEIQKDVGNLTKRVEPTVSGNESEEGPQRMQIMITKEENEEIARVKLFADDLRKEIENLKMDKLGLLAQVENNASLISSLQKGVDANYKLHTKSEIDLAASHDVIVKQKQTIEQCEAKIASLQSELELRSELQNRVRADKANPEIEARNRELEVLLNDWRSYGATKEKEIEEANKLVTVKDAEINNLRNRLDSMNNDVDVIMPELRKQIENLERNFTETTSKNRELDGYLGEWKIYAGTKEKEIEEANKIVTVKNTEISKLRDQLDSLSNDVSVIVPELKNQIENLERNFTETTAKKNELEGLLSEWKTYAGTKHKEKEEANKMLAIKAEEVCKLRYQLDSMNNDVAVKAPELQSQMKNVDKNGIAEKNVDVVIVTQVEEANKKSFKTIPSGHITKSQRIAGDDNWNDSDSIPIKTFVSNKSNDTSPNKSMGGKSTPIESKPSHMLQSEQLPGGILSSVSMLVKSTPFQSAPSQSNEVLPDQPKGSSPSESTPVEPTPDEPTPVESTSVEMMSSVILPSEPFPSGSTNKQLPYQQWSNEPWSNLCYRPNQLWSIQDQHNKPRPIQHQNNHPWPIQQQQSQPLSMPIQLLRNERLSNISPTNQASSVTTKSLMNVDSNDVIVRCICGLFLEGKIMIQCRKCSVWQHVECTGADVNVDNYMCERCDNRTVDMEIPLNEDTDEGGRNYLTLMRGDLQVHITDAVYILRDIPITTDAESTSVPKKHTYKTIDKIDFANECDIFRVERLRKDNDGNRFAFGYHYLRPHETFHKASKKFYENEVLRVPLYENLPIDLIMGRCWVLDPKTFCKGRPIHCEESDTYICEVRVDKARRTFSKISKPEYPVSTKSYAFKYFEQKLKISRNYMPHHADNAKM